MQVYITFPVEGINKHVTVPYWDNTAINGGGEKHA